MKNRTNDKKPKAKKQTKPDVNQTAFSVVQAIIEKSESKDGVTTEEKKEGGANQNVG